MYGRRQLKSLYNKNKWTLLISVWSTAIICLYIHHIPRLTDVTVSLDKLPSMSVIEDEKISELPGQSKPTVQIKYYDVLLNSYMRSGSTLSGIILGWRDDAFYLYEPLWKISRWAYWHGNDTMCLADRFECRRVEPGKAVQDNTFLRNKDRRLSGSLVMAKTILRKFYDCQFNDFDRTVFHPRLTDKLGGPSWDQVEKCMVGQGNPKLCLHRFAPRKCKNATHRVSKVLRLTTDHLEYLLRERENLKVIHLFRDPRAVINSRNRTNWYPARTMDGLTENAKSLCNRMLYDLRKGKRLLKLYPDRFRFIYYEDLNENPFDKAVILYKYLGMDLNESKYPSVRKLPVFGNTKNSSDRVKNTAFWWRLSLKWDIVKKMDSICAEVYKELGYKSMSTIEEYRNVSVSSVDIPKEYLMA